jgi:hypothetical protein
MNSADTSPKPMKEFSGDTHLGGEIGAGTLGGKI